MTTITIPRALLEQALDALEAAKNGLLWYQDTYPDATNDSDDEAMCKIDSALETLRAELAKPATAPDDQLRKDVELLLTNANWNVGGVLSEESRRRDYPSNGVANVRLRDLARLRDDLKGTP